MSRDGGPPQLFYMTDEITEKSAYYPEPQLIKGNMEEELLALLFNVQGYLHELLKAKF